MSEDQSPQGKKTTRRPWPIIKRLGRDLLVVVVVMVAAEWFLTRNAAHGPAPSIHGPTVAGTPFQLDQLHGEAGVIHFWASWCPVCRLEEGSIDSLAKGYPFISVAMQSGSEGEVAAYLQKGGLTFPVVNDPEGVIAARYGVTAVPATFVVDPKGQIRFVTRGYTSGVGLRLRIWLAGLLG